MQKMCIVMPAYNEEKRIGDTLIAYSNYFKNYLNYLDYEILVVINNTKDNTEEVVREIQKTDKKIRFLNFGQGGKGFAVIEGFKDALNGDSGLIGFVDSDLATPPEAFFALVKNIGNCEGIIASRWHEKSIIKTPQTMLRKITSSGFNFLVKSILQLNYSDTQCGAKLFRRKAVEEIVRNSKLAEWAFDIDFLYTLKKKGFAVKEIPTIWQDKKGSKVNLMSVPLQMFLSIMRIRLINSPLNFIVKLYDSLPEIIKLNHKIS